MIMNNIKNGIMKVTITFDIPDNQLDYCNNTRIISTDSFKNYHDPCVNCPNNPAVNPNASGICNCALPSMRNPIY